MGRRRGWGCDTVDIVRVVCMTRGGSLCPKIDDSHEICWNIGFLGTCGSLCIRITVLMAGKTIWTLRSAYLRRYTHIRVRASTILNHLLHHHFLLPHSMYRCLLRRLYQHLALRNRNDESKRSSKLDASKS